MVMAAVFLLTIFANSSKNLIFAMDQTGWQSKKINMSALGLESPEAAEDVSSAWSNGGGSYLYYGNYVQSGTSETDKKEPIKWQILSTANGQLFLLSDQVLDRVSFNEPGEGEYEYEKKVTDANQYSSSNIRKWLNSRDGIAGSYTSSGFLNTAFTEKEQSYLAEFNKLEDADGDIVNNLQGSSVTGDKVVILSAAEAASGEYGFAPLTQRC